MSNQEEIKLWKKTWGRNINMTEITLILNWKELTSLSATKWKKIQKFRTGEFDTNVMEEYLTDMQSQFKNDYEPDAEVIKYNIEHYRDDLHLKPSEISYTADANTAAKSTKKPLQLKVKPSLTKAKDGIKRKAVGQPRKGRAQESRARKS